MTALNRRGHDRFNGSRLAREENVHRASDGYVLGNDSFAGDNRASRRINQSEFPLNNRQTCLLADRPVSVHIMEAENGV